MLDIIGIGVGPFNLSLAALLKKTEITAKFFEQQAAFNWHKGMILPSTTLQVPFMADLVTLIDPTSPYSFLNYLHTQHRLLKFYFLEEFKIYRKEYNHYCQWVAEQLDSLSFDAAVIDVMFDNDDDGFVVTVCEQGTQKTYHAKNLVIGTGTQAALPSSLQAIAKKAPHRCMHTAHFADNFDLDRLDANRLDLNSVKAEDKLTKILVLGSGQSSAEVYRTLFDQQFDDEHNDHSNGNAKFQLDWMTRSAGFFPMEYSPLGLEHFSPAYTDYFYGLNSEIKPKVAAKQDLLYKGMGFETIRDIYHRLYERSINNKDLHSTLISNCEVTQATLAESLDSIRLTMRQREQNQIFTADYDCVIAGTGYRYGLPECLNTLFPDILHDAFGQPVIDRDYILAYQKNTTGKIFVQNQEIHTHGVGAPDLGLGAYRAGCIVNQLTGKQIYDTDALPVFQKFGA
ncbi:lysine N(6)-hydroxylase/L-ornithine N(5)-oxygenase family protein [Psychrobacter pocilloporae]|uniref:lysine N(6)-hydroxylase/L-ornithine N(5)-oxygenase family protein n=1 Tax=Psychrobacter TaxID=497 RepID=UPI001CBD776A|nr:SidA/IucD/PvdA family monooxygenase [Psychrobacter pacificensis]MBZ1392949.1 SidA/IucD/PvdA family monooxygenase [Psychrobacter pacificensis]MDE0842879.1 SidA/IucD/PvdA family monooxygenase [Psychrobacter pacificensis]